MNLKCQLTATSDVEHLQQIYTGFSLLHKKGVLKLKQIIPQEFTENKSDSDRWVNYNFFNAFVTVNDKIRVCYDTHDWNWIDEEILGNVDFYFKRSFDEDFLTRLPEKHKVFPLGLNYQVNGDKADFFRLQRAAFFGGKEKIKLALKALRLDNFLPNAETERLDRMENAPDYKIEPKVLFMARAWNTEKIEDKKQKEIVRQINETRAECVRALRKEFGARFFGGLMHDDFSQKHFKDALLPDNSLSNKRKYLETLKNFPVCVATRGLNDSNGWKLAEYVAFSKAIVTEPLKFRVTGDFEREKNYLEFSGAEELIGSVSRLFEDKDLRREMMKNNREYYLNFVRPDALVLNSLKVIANHSEFSL
jgi:hypothetical protein